jgi:DNA-binding LacI/PurR family transcriptional regulator
MAPCPPLCISIDCACTQDSTVARYELLKGRLAATSGVPYLSVVWGDDVSEEKFPGVELKTEAEGLPSGGGRTGRGRSAPGSPVTSYDVARLAGVSQSAVSRCFKTGGSVSKKTRDKVMRAVNELGYQPNALARGLSTKRSNMVAVIVANLGFNPDFTAQLSRCFSERSIHVLLFTVDHEADADRAVDQIRQYRVDGVVAAVRLSADHIAQLSQRNIPLVFLNRFYDDISVNAVCCDQAHGERVLVDRLVGSGHRRFGVVSGPEDSVVSQKRVAGALSRLEELGIARVGIVVGSFGYDSGRAALRELMADPEGRPDAVICANDLMAIGCMDEARYRLGLNVPGDLSIVGFDGASQARWASYDLTTIRQPVRAMSEAAADMLLARVKKPFAPAETRMFSGDLVTGTSAKF